MSVGIGTQQQYQLNQFPVSIAGFTCVQHNHEEMQSTPSSNPDGRGLPALCSLSLLSQVKIMCLHAHIKFATLFSASEHFCNEST